MLATTTSDSQEAPSRGLPLSDELAWFGSIIVLGGLVLAYWLSNYMFPGNISPDLQIYVVRPLMYVGVGLVALRLWRSVADRPFADKAFIWLAVLAALFNISALICAGVLLGFGHSPYARDIIHMLQNAWYLGTFIFGLEMSRAYLLTVWSRYNALLAFAAVSIIIGGLWFAPGIYENLTIHDRTLQTAGRTFMPGAAESVMATFLASIGGPLPAFIYHFGLEGFRWLSPILPRLEWTIAAFVGTMAPALAMLIVRDTYFNMKAKAAEALGEEALLAESPIEAKGGVSPLILLAGGLIVALIWLNTGMLGVKPYLVSGPSMEPDLGPGDIVFTQNVDSASLKPGDVVKFKLSGGSVIHRVVEVGRTNQGVTLITKGDNNNTVDPPVVEAQIEGKVVFDVPYIGWVPVAIKNLLNGAK